MVQAFCCLKLLFADVRGCGAVLTKYVGGAQIWSKVVSDANGGAHSVRRESQGKERGGLFIQGRGGRPK